MQRARAEARGKTNENGDGDGDEDGEAASCQLHADEEPSLARLSFFTHQQTCLRVRTQTSAQQNEACTRYGVEGKADANYDTDYYTTLLYFMNLQPCVNP